MAWIENDEILNWAGAKVLNMAAIQQVKGKRGGLAIIVNPELEFTEIHRCAVGVDFNALKKSEVEPEHLQLANLANAEECLPEGDINIAQSIAADVVDTTPAGRAEDPETEVRTQKHTPQRQRNQGNKTQKRKRRSKRKAQQEEVDEELAAIADTDTANHRTRKCKKKKKETEAKKAQDFIQAISIQLTNGLVITGAYVSPQTTQEATTRFIEETMGRYGENQVLLGDINARHIKWDKTTNGRGLAVMEVVQKLPRTYVLAANKPSYYKVVTRAGGQLETWSSNPDIAILRTQEATAYINDRDWTGISDHRPVTYTVKSNLKLKEVRRRVAKSLFTVPAAVKEAKGMYEAGIDKIIERLNECSTRQDETETQKMYTEVEKYITDPWERIIKRRPPRKPLWWNRTIGTAQQKRRYLARKWHKAKADADRWRDSDLCEQAENLHEELTEQQKLTRRLSRQAKAQLDRRTNDKLKEAGLTAQSRAINRDRRGKALRSAEALRTGQQLIPADFTKYMGEQQGKHTPIKAREFKVNNRKFRRRLKRAILAMDHNKAVGADNIHAEMMQTAPALFARLLAKVWDVVGETKTVPNSWTVGILVPLHKSGAHNKPENHRPLCMLSHVRKAIERAVVDELDELITPDRMQFGFQRGVNTLQAAIDVAAVISEAVGYLIAVLDLTKAYDRVVRARLIEKLEKLGVPKNLVNQIIVFLVPLIAHTAGDVTKTIAVLTTGLTQGGSASPALFRIFIDDLAGALRRAQGKDGAAKGDSLDDPAKLVADDVIIVAKNDEELQVLLNTCTEWANENELEWKPQKCAVIADRTTQREGKQYMLAGQQIPLKDERRYLGILISMAGFTKANDSDLQARGVRACAATISQPFYDANLSNNTLRTLYRTNVRSILMYGLMLTRDTKEIEKLDRKLLNMYFKPITQHKKAMADRLIDRLCLRLRLPSLAIELETTVKSWLARLRSHTNTGSNKKIRQHATDTLRAIRKMKPDTILKKYYTIRGGNKQKVLLAAFQKWNTELAPAKASSRVVDKVTKLRVDKDILDAVCLTKEEKCSAYRYIVYRFPAYTPVTQEEEESLKLIMKQELSKHERSRVIHTLREVHRRDNTERKRVEEVKAKEKVVKQNAKRQAKKEAVAADALLALTRTDEVRAAQAMLALTTMLD